MSRTYDFYLKDGSRYDLDTKISLPSVTTIISAVLAKPQLVDWSYRTTLETIAWYVNQNKNSLRQAFKAERPLAEDFLDTFSDPEMLDEWIRESGVHHSDYTQDASERGDRAHKVLATLASLHLGAEAPEAAMRHAERLSVSARDPYVRAVCLWWAQRKPRPVLSEHVVVSLRHGFAGRFDLLAELEVGTEGAEGPSWAFETALIDLKTRRADLSAYDSDMFQLGLYEVGLRERTKHAPNRRLVLLASDDGEPAREVEAWIPPEAALPLVSVYYDKRKTDPRGE